MILLNKFIEPTLATGKILQDCFRNNNSKKITLCAINVRGLYLDAQKVPGTMFIYPSFDEIGQQQDERPIYTYFDKAMGRFTYKINKNNKQIEIRCFKCLGCPTRIIRLAIGKNTKSLYIGGKERNCEFCAFQSLVPLCLFQEGVEIKAYRQYYNEHK